MPLTRQDWFFDYRSGEVLEGPPLAEPTSHPGEQPAPGPDGRVPGDWMSRIHH